MSNLTAGLLITLIGMGLVFIALLLLWGLMDLMVRLTNRFFPDREESGAGEDEDSGEEPAAPLELSDEALRQQAAAAAVAVSLSHKPLAHIAAAAVAAALTVQARQKALAASPQSGSASSWQSVHRANRLSQRLNLFNRKSTRN
jgi:sodium pump decarboxylase gamma subunit